MDMEEGRLVSRRVTSQRYVPCGAQRRWGKGEAHWILGTKRAHKGMDLQADRKWEPLHLGRGRGEGIAVSVRFGNMAVTVTGETRVPEE